MSSTDQPTQSEQNQPGSSDAASTKVCVTGASGFIAAHIVKQLLDAGYQVKATVRGEASRYPYLTSLDGAAERLEFAQASLQDEGAFDAIVADCDVVMHTASPYIVNVKDPQRDLVDPAVQGTNNVLNACAKSSTVKRVVLTSSVAAVTDEASNEITFSEDNWNTKSDLKRNPYFYSKTLAERAAWDFVEKNKPGFDLVAINPFMVIGPSLGPGLNESNKILSDILSGAYPTLMSVTWGIVDVRDVAKAHVLAMETPKAKGRYLVSNETMTMTEVVKHLRDIGYSQYKLPSINFATPFGDIIMKLLSYTQPKGSGSYMRSHIGKAMRYTNAKVKQDLGIEFIPAKDSIRDAVADLLKWDHLKAKKAA